MSIRDIVGRISGQPAVGYKAEDNGMVKVPGQKFRRGDLVRIAADLGPARRHFPADQDALVLGSYRDKFGNGREDSYALHLLPGGNCSWYEEEHLTLVRHAGENAIRQAEGRAPAIADHSPNQQRILDGQFQFLADRLAELDTLRKGLVTALDSIRELRGENARAFSMIEDLAKDTAELRGELAIMRGEIDSMGRAENPARLLEMGDD